MECKAIRAKLYPYLDGALPAEEGGLVEEHLKSCPLCRAALEDLRKTGDLVRNLDEVEPPPWLQAKIMARVREEQEKKKGFLHKLFFPLHIKVPIQAMATVFIAVIAVYVFHTVEPDLQKAKLSLPVGPLVTQEEKPQPAPEQKGEVQPPPGRASETHLKKKVKPATPGAPSSGIDTARQEEKSLAPPAAAARLEKDRAAASALREGVEAARKEESAALRPAAEPPAERPRYDTKGGGGAASRESFAPKSLPAPSPSPMVRRDGGFALNNVPSAVERRKTAAPPPVMTGATSQASATGVTVAVKDRGAANAQIEKILAELGGRVSGRDSFEGRETVTAELPASRVGDFYDRLLALGEVSEKRLPPDHQEGEVTVRIGITSAP
jgi:hypothetical protein